MTESWDQAQFGPMRIGTWDPARDLALGTQTWGPGPGELGFGVFLEQSILCCITGHHNPSRHHIYQYLHFSFWTSGTCLYKSSEQLHVLARKVYLRTGINTCSWKFKMKHAIKDDVYLDVLLVLSSYATTSLLVFHKNTTES